MKIQQRIAVVIGCGRTSSDGWTGWAIGHAHAHAYRKADPNLRLLGVDVNPEYLQAFGEKFGVADEDLFSSTDALYEKLTPDYVSICTWPGLHAPQVIEAAARGVRGIACEKPMAVNGAEIDAMLAACRRSGTRLAVAHQRCYADNFQRARQFLHEGAIGTNWVLEARVNDGWDVLSWTVHWFDIVHWLFGAAPLSVMAGLDHTGERRYGHAVENTSVVFADYPNSRQAIFVSGPANHQLDSQVFVRGTGGLLRVSNTVEIWNANGYRKYKHEGEETDAFAALLLDLFSAVENGTVMQCDAERCAIATRTAFTVHEAARTMRRIDAPFITEYAPLETVQNPSRPRLPAGRVVLFADEHYNSGGREGIRDAVKQITGEIPVVIDATKGLTATDLDGAGLLLLYHTQQEADSATQAALTGWIDSGRPTVFVHAAVGGYPAWEKYKSWAGMVWAWGDGGSEHPYDECTLTAVGEDFSAWAIAWLPRDEVYIKLQPTNDIEMLVQTKIPSGVFPAAWRSRQFPNVTAWVPGHRREMWTLPAMREGLLAMIQLAARAVPVSR